MKAATATRPALEPIEVRILTLLAAGRTHSAIAHQIGASTDTVSWRLSRLYGRIGARNATHAVAIAIRTGLLPEVTS